MSGPKWKPRKAFVPQASPMNLCTQAWLIKMFTGPRKWISRNMKGVLPGMFKTYQIALNHMQDNRRDQI